MLSKTSTVEASSPVCGVEIVDRQTSTLGKKDCRGVLIRLKFILDGGRDRGPQHKSVNLLRLLGYQPVLEHSPQRSGCAWLGREKLRGCSGLKEESGAGF